MPGLVKLIASDLRAKAAWCYGTAGWKNILKTLLTDGTAAMFYYRFMQSAGRWRLAPLEMIFNRMNTIFCGCTIGRGADFGPGFVLIHSLGVFINGAVRGGSNIKIEHEVTIGAEQQRCPVLGSDIFIGAGAKIIGSVNVGDSARVGANSVVMEDVPAGATVAGNPGRLVAIRNQHNGSQ